jgi:hypothetical protein
MRSEIGPLRRVLLFLPPLLVTDAHRLRRAMLFQWSYARRAHMMRSSLDLNAQMARAIIGIEQTSPV